MMINSSSVSIFSLIAHAGIVVQFVMLILLIASLYSWAIIFDKFYKFNLLKKRSNSFEEAFENDVSLDRIYQDAKNNDNHPIAKIFLACINEWKLANIHQISHENSERKIALKERLINAMQVANSRAMVKMENGLNFLAIIGSSAPFVVLFGTVWGILNSFQAIAVSSNTSLSVVAPGIAESLLATAIGFVMGGIQSNSRATYAKLCPTGEKDTASYFSFYDVCDRLSTVIGTFMFGLIIQLTGNMRISILVLVFVFGASLLFLRPLLSSTKAKAIWG
jgi:biopolymer transport protein TolQ